MLNETIIRHGDNIIEATSKIVQLNKVLENKNNNYDKSNLDNLGTLLFNLENLINTANRARAKVTTIHQLIETPH